MDKLSPKPIDIINAAVSEIYGNQAIELLRLTTALTDKGIQRIIELAEEYNENPKYMKAIKLCE